jgi:lipopolysaccharide/colanic/teichoic acid biosynthesis glycosyltransferase
MALATVPFQHLEHVSPGALSTKRAYEGKRVFDAVAAAAILLFVAPLFVVVMLLVAATSSGPVFFSQERIGRGGKIFRCWKFRTMVVNSAEVLDELLARDADARREWQATQKLKSDPRITRIGRFLRMTSIDELPQLLNVLLGDMSLVGPRPIVASERERYGRYLLDYCSVRPGLTGLWQVSGRNDTSYRRRVALDVFYARRCSFLLDSKILLITPGVIVQGDGCY